MGKVACNSAWLALNLLSINVNHHVYCLRARLSEDRAPNGKSKIKYNEGVGLECLQSLLTQEVFHSNISC